MATNGEIVFVGLVSLLNLTNTQTSDDFPPPSAIVHTHSRHQPFIVFDARELNATGATLIDLDDPNYKMIELEKGGEDLELRGVATGLPTVDRSTLNQVAKFPEYSRIAGADLDWDEDYVPKRKNKPKGDKIAAYVTFGEGELKAARSTRLKYDFVLPHEQPVEANAKAYLRDVHYTFTTATTGLQIEATSLKNESNKRTLDFQLKNGATKVKLWIGSSTHPLLEVEQYEPNTYETADHFSEYYKTESRADNANTDPIPVPVPIYYDGTRAPARLVVTSSRHHVSGPQKLILHANHVHRVRGDPEVGYCGGSQGGCNPCP